jgi:Na+-transporting NADH:ubiquinone oxidoreductase subunit A
MGSFTIKKGLDIHLAGAPAKRIVDGPVPESVVLCPSDYEVLKPRLLIKEGDSVKRGSPLFCNKQNEAFVVRSPASGVVKQIVYGPRRAIESVVIQSAPADSVEILPRFEACRIRGLARKNVLDHLLTTGLLCLIRQRPFSRMADPEAEPKAIFVNGMGTAPLQPDVNVLVQGREDALQAGLDAMATLTKGKVHLCLDGRGQNARALTDARNVEVHTFSGPHPAGNTSVHISRIDPIKPRDIVWTLRVSDAILIGELLLRGEAPGSCVVALAGAGAREAARQYYRVRVGAPLQAFLDGRLADGEQRVIRGDVLSGGKVAPGQSVSPRDTLITVIPEDRSRHFLGWLAPGVNLFSASKTFLSGWLGGRREWSLGTSQHGELRPMVLTGLYDKYMPMNIMVDYLVRAVLANDTEEAIKLGILETDPEDFALCAVACPSKMDLVGIVRRGLVDIEKEGI